jgi:hypothetical protein
MKRTTFLVLVGLLLACASGCVEESVDGVNRVYTYPLWLPLTVFLGGMVGGVAGWMLRNSISRLAWALLIGGPIAAILFAPSLLRDRAVVGADSFSLRSGIWGLTAVHEVKFADLTSVRIVAEEVRGRRGSKRTNYYLVCERKDGTSAKVPLNNSVSEAAAPALLERLNELDIPVVNAT